METESQSGPRQIAPPAIRSETLHEENQRLKELVVTLSAIVLKNATGRFDERRLRLSFSADGPDIVQFAEQCFSFARIPSVCPEVAIGLDRIGHSLMAKAVEIESVLQREKWIEERTCPAENERPLP